MLTHWRRLHISERIAYGVLVLVSLWVLVTQPANPWVVLASLGVCVLAVFTSSALVENARLRKVVESQRAEITELSEACVEMRLRLAIRGQEWRR